MHSRHDTEVVSEVCSLQAVDQFHSPICEFGSAKKQHAQSSFSKSIKPHTSAGVFAGVFFGRLTRRFGKVPSRRISGPSAEFISVTRLRTSAFAASQESGAANAPLRAPMNNPNRKEFADGFL
jgi:hypothetical protein